MKTRNGNNVHRCDWQIIGPEARNATSVNMLMFHFTPLAPKLPITSMFVVSVSRFHVSFIRDGLESSFVYNEMSIVRQSIGQELIFVLLYPVERRLQSLRSIPVTSGNSLTLLPSMPLIPWSTGRGLPVP